MFRLQGIYKIELAGSKLNNITKNIRNDLENKIVGTFQGTSFIEEVTDIVSISTGKLSKASLQGSVIYDVIYNCIAHRYERGDLLFDCKVESVKESGGGIFLRHKHIQIIIDPADLTENIREKIEAGQTVTVILSSINPGEDSTTVYTNGYIYYPSWYLQDLQLSRRTIKLPQFVSNSKDLKLEPFLKISDIAPTSQNDLLGYHDSLRYTRILFIQSLVKENVESVDLFKTIKDKYLGSLHENGLELLQVLAQYLKPIINSHNSINTLGLHGSEFHKVTDIVFPKVKIHHKSISGNSEMDLIICTKVNTLAEVKNIGFLFKNIYDALHNQKKGGSLVLHCTDLFCLTSLKLIFLLWFYYDQVIITKTLVGVDYSGSRWIIATGFKGITSDTLKILDKINNGIKKITESQYITDLLFPESGSVPWEISAIIRLYNEHIITIQLNEMRKILWLQRTLEPVDTLSTNFESIKEARKKAEDIWTKITGLAI